MGAGEASEERLKKASEIEAAGFLLDKLAKEKKLLLSTKERNLLNTVLAIF